MLSRCFAVAVAFGCLLIATTSDAGDEPKKKAKGDAKTDTKLVAPKATAKPGTVKVEKGPLTIVVNLKGTIQAAEMAELAVRPKSWTAPMIVSKAVEHGTPVKAGDVVIEFDTEKIDHQIRDIKQERALAEIAIRQAELELPLLEKQATLDLAAAERSSKQADEDLKHFLKTDRPLSEQAAEFRLKTATFFLEQAKEELKQLQKMYKDKDLTEETEQHILRRYQFMVEMEEFLLKQTRVYVDRTLKVDLPRREQSAKDALVHAEVMLTKARDVQPLQVKQKQLALAKLVFDELRSKDRLAELEKDRAALTVRAPIDGLAYYGRVFRGHWITPGGPNENSLLPGTPVQPNNVFLTIVNRAKLVVVADAEEKELPGLTAGLAATLTPTAFPGEKVAAKVSRVAAVPLGSRFEVLLEPDAKSAGLAPGMTCGVRVVTYRKADALTVPASAVFDNEENDTQYVYRAGKGDKQAEKQTVTLGRRSGDRVEVLSGLAAGDEILTSKPGDK